MATRHLFGSAAITFTPPGESEETHLLGAKLIELEPMDTGERDDWWSVDRENREVVTVGDGVSELIATIRYDDEPGELKRMLRLALRHNLTLIYEPEIGGTSYPVKLVAVVGATSSDRTPISPDRDRRRLGEYEARIHVRRIDGGNLDDLL
ncbi:MAG: hypothetical protein ACOC9T_00315 [Myxococcota bacterium]